MAPGLGVLVRLGSPLVAAQFSVVFDGPAIGNEASIDASLYGSSLLALSELVQEAQETIDAAGVQYRVRVRAEGEGSFEVTLELAELWGAVSGLFSSKDADAVANLIAIFGTSGLLGLLLWLHNRRPDGVVGDTFYVEGESFVAERNVGKLYSSRKVRRSLRAFVGPVSRGGVEEMSVRIPDHDPIRITPDDRAALDAPIDDEVVTDEVVRMQLRIEAVRFRSTRWEFRERSIGLLWATIEDEGFMRSVRERTETFGAGDLLDCQVRVRQWDEGGGSYKTDYTVLSVLDHRRADDGEQLSIPD